MSQMVRVKSSLASAESVGLVDRIAAKIPGIGRYTAGPRISDAVAKMKVLSERNMGSIANVLGEHDKDKAVIGRTFSAYCMLIEGIRAEGLRLSCISLKPTQFGLDHQGSEGAAEMMVHIAGEAMKSGIFVWLDMENRHTTDFTLDLYRKFVLDGKRAGIALQANLKRTHSDLLDLMALSRKEDVEIYVRFVRGIYRENEDVAFLHRGEMHRSFARLMRSAFFDGGTKFRVSVGTHHPDQIIRALALSREFEGKLWDLQFLLGAVSRIPAALTEAGIPCTYYVPCGPRFLDYGLRRLRENPGGIWGLITARFREGRNLRAIGGFLHDKTTVELNDPELAITSAHSGYSR